MGYPLSSPYLGTVLAVPLRRPLVTSAGFLVRLDIQIPIRVVFGLSRFGILFRVSESL